MLTNTVHSSVLAETWLEKLKDRYNNPGLNKPISTGLKDLDDMLDGGVLPGQQIIWGGSQKSGKTTLMLNVAISFARQGIPFIWFGAEMTNMQIGNLLFANIARVNRGKFKNLNIEVEDWGKLEAAKSTIETFNGYWNYGFSTIKDVTEIMEQVEEETGTEIKAIFVDYIQLMEGDNKRDSRTQQIEKISRELKRLSIAWKRPIITNVAAQLNRESIRDNKYDANSFLGSGGIERDMDVGIVVMDVIDDITGKPKPNVKLLRIVAGRDVKTGETEVFYDGSIAFYGNIVQPQTINMTQIKRR